MIQGATGLRSGAVAAGEAVEGAEFVAGGTILFLFGDGGEVGDVVVGRHGDGAHPEALEGWMAVEQGAVLGVGVEEVEGMEVAGAGAGGLGGFHVAEVAAEDGQLEGMEEEGDDGSVGERMGGGVGVGEGERSEGVGGGVLAPEFNVGLGDVGEVGVELDAFGAEKGELGGEQEGAAFAGADVEEDGAFDGSLGIGALEPEIEQGVEDAGSDAVVGGELFGLVRCAAGDDGAGDEAGGIGAVEAVEGMDDGLGWGAGHRGLVMMIER
jgi:hypothetical protein